MHLRTRSKPVWTRHHRGPGIHHAELDRLAGPSQIICRPSAWLETPRTPPSGSTGKVIYDVPLESGATEVAAAHLERARAVLEQVVDRGQELGAVRRDPPDGLLVAAGVAEAADRWMVDAWEALPRAALDPLALSLFDVLRTMASPPHGGAQR